MTRAICGRPRCPYLTRSNAEGLCQKHRRAYIRNEYPAGYILPTDNVVTHLNQLRGVGLAWKRISELTGGTVSITTLRAVAKRERTGITAAKAERILAITPVALVPDAIAAASNGSFVPMIGTTRRAQALVAIGYCNEYICANIGYSNRKFHRILFGKGPYVAVATHRAMCELFTLVESTPAPPGYASNRARKRAARSGWAKPFDWDEEDIDDPTATPHTATARPLTIIERYDEAVELGRISVHRGLTAAAEHLDVDRDSLGTALLRARRAEHSNDVQQAS